MEANLAVKLNSVTPDMVDKIYSGKQGCMCGCRGKYFEGRGVGRVLAGMKRYAKENHLTGEVYTPNLSIVFLSGYSARNYVVYLKEGIYAELV